MAGTDGSEAVWNRAAEKDERVAGCKRDGYGASCRVRADGGQRFLHSTRVKNEDPSVPDLGARAGVVDAGDHRQIAFADIAMQTKVMAVSPVVRVRPPAARRRPLEAGKATKEGAYRRGVEEHREAWPAGGGLEPAVRHPTAILLAVVIDHERRLRFRVARGRLAEERGASSVGQEPDADSASGAHERAASEHDAGLSRAAGWTASCTAISDIPSARSPAAA